MSLECLDSLTIMKQKNDTLLDHTVSCPKRCVFLFQSAALQGKEFSRPSYIETGPQYSCQSFLGDSAVKNPPAMQEMQVQHLSQEDPREEKIAIHSSIFAWRIPWAEESGGLQSMGSQRVRHGWATKPRPSWYYLLLMEIINRSHLVFSVPSIE